MIRLVRSFHPANRQEGNDEEDLGCSSAGRIDLPPCRDREADITMAPDRGHRQSLVQTSQGGYGRSIEACCLWR